MQEKPKRNKTGIIIAAVVVVLMVVLMIVWQRYEAKHKAELESSVLTADLSQISAADKSEPRPQSAQKPIRVIPDDSEKLLTMAEEALADEGYFEGQNIGKGFHVYFLLKKCLDCDGDPGKVEGLVKRLKDLSDESYGTWHVDPANLTDLDEKLVAAKQM